MQFEFYAERPLRCQWDIKTRNQNFAESVANFEFAQGRVVFVAIVEHPISEVRNSLFFAQRYRFGNQRVRRSLVTVTCFGKERQDGRHISAVDKL